MSSCELANWQLCGDCSRAHASAPALNILLAEGAYQQD